MSGERYVGTGSWRGRLLTLSLTILVLVSGVSGSRQVRAQAAADLVVASSTQTLRAASNNTVTFMVTNKGGLVASQIFISLAMPSAPSGGTSMILVGSDGKWFRDGLNPGSSYNFTTILFVSPSASGGIFQLTFTLTYIAGGPQKTDSRTIGVNVPPIEAVGAVISTSLEPHSLKLGQNNTLTLTLKNTGDLDAMGVFATLSIPGASSGSTQLALIGTDGRFSQGMIPAGGQVSYPVIVYASLQSSGGTYQAELSITYSDLLRTRSENRFLTLVSTSVGPSASLDVSLDKSELKTGAVNNVTLTVKNTGDGPADSLTVQLSLPSSAGSPSVILIGNDGVWSYKSLAAGASQTIPIKVFVNPSASSTLLSFSVTSSYTDMGYKSKQIVNPLGLIARGSVAVAILGTSVFPSPVASGGALSLTVNFINQGTTTAQGVILTPGSVSGLVQVGGRVFLGDISVDVPSSFTVPYRLSGATSGNYTITMGYTYKDALGGNFTGTMIVPLSLVVGTQTSVSGQGQSTGSGFFRLELFLLVIIILVVVIVILLLRHRKRED